LSLSRRAAIHEDAVRRLRPEADVLGHRSHAHALHLLRVHPPLHRPPPLAQRRGSRLGHGPRRLRMARLAPAGIRVGSPGRILGLVVLMTPLSGAGIDIYVPSLVSMTEYFFTTAVLLMITLSMLFLVY